MNKQTGGEQEKWRGIIAEALKLAAGDVAIKLLAAGVNNAVYQVSVRGRVGDGDVGDGVSDSVGASDEVGDEGAGGESGGEQKLILRVPAAGKKLMSYGAIADKQIKDRFATYALSGHSPQLVDLDLPDGGILCEFIAGRPAKFPTDLSLIVRSLAALHTSGLDAGNGAGGFGGAGLSGKINATGSVATAGSGGNVVYGSNSGRVGGATEHNTISYATMLRVIKERFAILDEVTAAKLKLADESYTILRQLKDICEQAPAKRIAEYEEASPLLPILKDANPSNFIIAGAGKTNRPLPASLNEGNVGVGVAGAGDIDGSAGKMREHKQSTSPSLKAGSMGGGAAVSGMSENNRAGNGDAGGARNERAVVVDIEGDFYGLPIIDVGHSSLFSASMWAYPDISPVAPAEIVGLYEEYYEAVAQLRGAELAKQVRPPSEIISSIRYGTLGRCLGWMLMLIYLAEVKGVATPADKLIRARAILSSENLQLAMDSEATISKLI